MTSILKVDEIQNTDGKTGIVITPDGSLESVKFPEATGGDPNRVITSTTMSSYEEGTWTPTSANSGSLTVHSGSYYTKVGRNVTLHINSAMFSDATSSNSLAIGGLPFAPSESCAVGSCMMSRRDDTIAVVPFISAGIAQIQFYHNSTTLGFVQLSHQIFQADNNALYMSITYQTNE